MIEAQCLKASPTLSVACLTSPVTWSVRPSVFSRAVSGETASVLPCFSLGCLGLVPDLLENAHVISLSGICCGSLIAQAIVIVVVIAG
jgi:hypothetical protein